MSDADKNLMIVYAERERRSANHAYLWKAGDVAEVNVLRAGFCCDAMREAWDERAVGFGEYDSILNRNEAVNIYKCSPYPEGAVWDEYPIRYCPFCASKVEVIVTEKAPQLVPAK